MIGGKKIDQSSGDGGTNVHSDGPTNIVINQGADEKRIREIAVDVTRQEMRILSSEARATAQQRANDFDDRLLTRVSEIEEKLEAFKRPDVQFALHGAKLSFAETGDATTRDVSIEMIARYIQSDENNSILPIYREALRIAPKINDKSVKVLSSIFFTFNCGCGLPFDKAPGAMKYMFLRDWLKAHFENSKFLTISDKKTENILEMYRLLTPTMFEKTSYNRWAELWGKNLSKPLDINFLNDHPTLTEENLLFQPSDGIAYLLHTEMHQSENLSPQAKKSIEAAREFELQTPNEAESTFLITSMFDSGVVKRFFESLSKGYTVSPLGMAIAISYLKRLGLALDEQIWLG